MSKRRKETSNEKWARLMEDYEKRFQEEPGLKRRRITYSSSSSENEDVPTERGSQDNRKLNRRRIIYSSNSEDEDVANKERLESGSVNAEALQNTTPVVSPNDDESLGTDSFDPELVKALGEAENEVLEYGDELQSDIANRFQQILINGLKKETREELTKKYLVPKNVPMAKAPTLNPEVSAMLVETCRLRDKRLLGKQDQLGRALAALGKAMTILLKKNPDISDVITTLNDAGKLIADSHFAETDTRRSVITPLIDKPLIESFKDRKRDSFLFGDKLSDLVNNSKGITKTSKIIQASTSANAGLNWRGPPSYRPRQQRAGQYYPRRGGGPPTTYPHPHTSRRRGPPMPPPGRRYPPPPPPPPPPPQSRRLATQAHRSTFRHRT